MLIYQKPTPETQVERRFLVTKSLLCGMGSSSNLNFDELFAQHVSVEEALLNAAPESISTSDAISFHLSSGYLEQLRISEGVRKLLMDQGVSPLERIKAAAIFASESHECTPPSLNPTIWSRFAPIEDLILEAALVGLLSISSEKNQQDDGLFQYYYTRILDIEPEEYARRLEQFGKAFPDELPFVILQLQYLGYGQRASVLLTSVMQAFGYKDVNVHLYQSVEGTFLSLKPSYSGTTTQAVHKRDAQDHHSGTTTSRMKNFLQLNEDLNWTIIRWDTLTCPISDRLDWRRTQDLGDIEAVLIDSTVLNFNKARGGWVPDIDPHPSIAKPLADMLKLLPKAQVPKPPPADLQKELYEMVEHEQVLMQKFQTIPNFGGVFGNSVTDFVKHEFADRIRCINGAVTHVNILEWVPQEVGTGQINSSLTSNEAGRAVTTYRKILRVIDHMDTGEEPDDEIIRAFDGPVIDFWRFPKLRNKWALSALILGLYLRRVRPYAIHTWSSEVSYLLRHHTLCTLPQALRDALNPSLQGAQAMKAIDVDILDNAYISQEINVPKDRGLRQRAGTLQKVIFGPGDQDFANALVKGYAGSMYYRQTHAKYDRRRFLYVHALSLALNRLTEDRAATTKPPQTQDERIAFLDAIAADFENVKVSSGVGHALDMEVHRQLIFDKAQGALIGKTVEEKEDGTMEERPKKRRKIEQYERSKALLARGGVKSAERMKQLEELRARDSLAEKLGVEGSFVGPDGDRASSEAFSK
ncbi:hypothetical protein M408DRAFT_27368, partial [Serendipita vermifera MAFF 305830]